MPYKGSGRFWIVWLGWNPPAAMREELQWMETALQQVRLMQLPPFVPNLGLSFRPWSPLRPA
jgi:hypothetical protein